MLIVEETVQFSIEILLVVRSLTQLLASNKLFDWKLCLLTKVFFKVTEGLFLESTNKKDPILDLPGSKLSDIFNPSISKFTAF